MLSFQKQPMMRRVLLALAPLWIFASWMYGFRTIEVAVVVVVLAVGVEWLFERSRGGKVSEAAIVSAALYGLALPPRTPLWIVAVGIVFAIAAAKGAYGGFGRNVFNPAIGGRLFVYIAFATVLNQGYMGAADFPANLSPFHTGIDVASSATPLALMRADPRAPVDIGTLILGTRPGALGESPIILIAIAAIFLLATKTANWRLMLSTIGSGAALTALLRLSGTAMALPLESLLAGSFLFVAVFMATDPVTAPKKKASQWIYGLLIGSVTVVIRTFSGFPEGTSFGILLGNTFAPFIDELVGKAKDAVGAGKTGSEAAR
ncbi:MAG: RnfABCDGE type electron transport complex subunit D [Spirochaetota bacterium]